MPQDGPIVDAQFLTGTCPGGRLPPSVAVPFPEFRQIPHPFYRRQIGSLPGAIFGHGHPYR
jgi:hypothetical protein